ncbi:Acb2/Tad1 domain-containing protein [Lysinibacillus sp. BSL11]
MPKQNFNQQIENNFKSHAPKEAQPEMYEAIREKAKELAYLIDYLSPNSREKSVAMTNLETAVFWANASIARN